MKPEMMNDDLINFINQNLDDLENQVSNDNLIDRNQIQEAAIKLQKLLQKLEEINPSATDAEKVSYLNKETTNGLKERVASALKAGGEAAFDQLILENKYLKVVKATIKGWFKYK